MCWRSTQLYFFVEAAAGLLAHSTALLADSLDMLGDSLVYGFSLYVLWRSAEWKAMAAVLKGVVMAAFGVGVLVEATYKLMAGVVPAAETMGVIGVLVLLAMGYVFFCCFAIDPTISICAPPGCVRVTTSLPTSRFCWPQGESAFFKPHGLTS